VSCRLPRRYRDAGREVVDVFCQFSSCVQRASIDEAYIDLTEAVERRITGLHQVQSSQLATTFVVGFTDVDSNDEGLSSEPFRVNPISAGQIFLKYYICEML
jgi:DNA polymerase eta